MSREMFDKMDEAVIEGKTVDVGVLAKEALEKDLDPLQCFTEGLTNHIQFP